MTIIKKTLLLVDDEPSILRALKRIFRSTDYTVLTAESGEQALEIIKENCQIQLIITDYRMPFMTGGELLSSVKILYPEIIGIILSGHADMNIVLRALNSGEVYQFLTKPFDKGSLIDVVDLTFKQNITGKYKEKKVLGVTQLLSRRELMESLKRWMEFDTLTTVYYLDVKNFQSFNDSLGFDGADQLLALIAQLLILNKPEASLLGQMSGGEFLLITPEIVSEDKNQQIIKTLLSPFLELVAINGRELHVSLSVGYSMSTEDGLTSKLLVRNAQAAVNYSKGLGSFSFLRYQTYMNERGYELTELQGDLFRALERNQLSVVYQPKISTHSGHIVGAEALLRWEHHSLGMIPPSVFIPLAESSDLIFTIGDWVLTTACKQGKFWMKQGLPLLLMSVNISGRQLQSNSLTAKVDNILNHSGFPPKLLELEITESFLIADIESSLQQLIQIKELGVRLSIDDFGTGYSSLSYLSRLPVDTLKIDRCFITELGESKQKFDLVKNFIQLSHDLGLTVVAEGVETPAQLNILKNLKCDEIQGYLFSRPVPAENFQILLQAQSLQRPAVI